MPTDEQRLLVSLEAKIDKFEKSMAKAVGVANAKSRQIEKRFQTMNAGVSSGLARLGIAFAGAFAANEFRQFADAASRISNSLKIAGLSGEELESVYDSLKASALENAAPLETLVELYSRVSLAQKELGVSSTELEAFSKNIAVALRVGGRTAQESSGALLQLSQALGSGTVRTEEFNSIQEGTLPILQAVAAGLNEAGGSVARLRSLVIEGKLSSQAFFRAFEAGAPMLKERLAGAQLTIGQSAENMRTAMIDAVGQFDKATGVSASLTTAMGDLSGSIEGVGDYFERNAPRIKTFQDAIGDMFAKIEEWKTSFRKSVGLDVIDDFLEGTSLIEGKLGFASDQVKQRTADLAASSNSLLTVGAALSGSGQPAKAPPKSVSILDFPVAGKAKGPAGGHASKAYENEMENIRDRTALLNAERDARARLNPLAVNYDEQVQTSITKQRLLNAAREEGLAITPQIEASIDRMAAGYAKATTEADKLEQSQRKIQDRAEEMSRLERDVMQGFISDMREGTSATEMLANALNKVADKLIDMAFDDLFAKPSAGGSGGISGIIGSLLKGFSGGGYTGPGGKYEPAGVVHRGEYVMNAAATRRIGQPALDAMNSGKLPGLAAGGLVGSMPSIPSFAKSPPAGQNGAGSSAPPINITTHVNIEKGDDAAVTRLIRELPKAIDACVMDGIQRGKFRLR